MTLVVRGIKESARFLGCGALALVKEIETVVECFSQRGTIVIVAPRDIPSVNYRTGGEVFKLLKLLFPFSPLLLFLPNVFLSRKNTRNESQ